MRILCCSAFALLFSGWAVAWDTLPSFGGSSSGGPTSPNVDALTTALKGKLPPGWSLVYRKNSGMIEISRDRDALVSRNDPNVRVPEKPVPRKIEFDLKIVAFVEPGDRRQFKQQSAEVKGILAALERQFATDGLKPDADGIYSPDGSEDPAAVAYYIKNRPRRHTYPDFYYRDMSLNWEFGYSEHLGIYPWPPTEPQVVGECRDVIKKIEGVLSSY
jgi:hypothetical protein